jgi:rod shape-determining protein MreD
MLAVLMLLSLVPLNIGILTDVRPMFLLIGVYYWSLFRPRFLSIFGLFVIGLFYDIMSGLPFGLTALILIGVNILIRSQRKILLHQPFWILWLVYITIATSIGGLSWGAHSLIRLHLIPAMPYVMEVLLSIAALPLLVPLLKLTNPPLRVHLGKK